MKICPENGSELYAGSSDPFIGQTVCARYEITHFVSAGGSASVYKAKDENGAAVAVKIMHDHLSSSPDYVRRFYREARALQNLSDAHLTHMVIER